MGGGLDLILLALLAGFIILRLVSVLGRRTGNEHRQENPAGLERASSPAEAKTVDLPGRDRAPLAPPAGAATGFDRDTPLGKSLSRIMVADHSFDPDGFLEGARAAYDMVTTAFAEGDRETLRSLLSPDVLRDFEAAIAEREAADQTMQTTIVDILQSEITDARLENGTADVTVMIKAELISVVRDSEGRIIEGNPSDTETVTDVWTFSRQVKARDPNWALVATDSRD
ncbi:Tim44/TimA family putative adaptor protein [Emcibacter sp. SYSU 3D8]|uniref:Tim44/TimA family putative adaptor protein n=1 Tax=Emcibacter sp. SYSU 3D8 TaxID=3133969 RepID=UPI0031FF1645